jgi:hypothetical protein
MMSDKQLRPVWGARNISKVLGIPLRKGFYLLEKNLVPARKVGKNWVSTEEELEDFLLGRVTPTELTSAPQK